MATVIASSSGTSLFVLPAFRGSVDREALARVLAKHGLELLPRAVEANEWIAAQGLPHADAARLAEDLRALGLTVRTVNKDALQRSSRVGNAVAAQMIAMIFTLPMGALALTTDVSDLLALLLVPGFWALMNFLVIAARGGGRLPVASTSGEATPVGELLGELEALRAELPDHVIEPLLARVAAVSEQARANPGGRAEAELIGLVRELTQARDEAAAAEVDDLRRELQKARKAVRELG